ncbi:MAG: sedoheptulokinase [Anaerolineae bacterium]
MTLLIGLDLGTTTITAALADLERGDVLRVARRRNDARLATDLQTRAEQNPARILALAIDALAELAAAGDRVDGIALTGQMHGIVCVDAHSRPLTPLVTWQDRRTSEPLPGSGTDLGHLRTRVADLDWRRNGCRIQHGYGAATLFWWIKQQALPIGARRVCDVAGWIAARLAGLPPAIDPTFAASLGIYDVVDGTWNTSFVDRLGIDERLLPPVNPSGSRIGGLVPTLAHRVGLVAGLPVYNPVGDNQASFIGATMGMGSDGRAEGIESVMINLGTGGQVSWGVSRFDPPNEIVETRPLPGVGYLRVGASLCGGAAYAWLVHTVGAWLREFGVTVDREEVFEKLNMLAHTCPDPGSLRVRPTFLGVRGHPEIEEGAIEGIGLGALSLGTLARATLIGIVDELYDLYAAQGGGSSAASRLIADGGAVRHNPLLVDLIKERFGLPTRLSNHPVPGAFGAVRLAALHSV